MSEISPSIRQPIFGGAHSSQTLPQVNPSRQVEILSTQGGIKISSAIQQHESKQVLILQQVNEVATQEQRVTEFSQHVEESNVDFKETIMKKVHTLKLKDTADLNIKVDEMKHDEFIQQEKLNKQYKEQEQNEHEEKEKLKKSKELMSRTIQQWEQVRKRRRAFESWRAYLQKKKKDSNQSDYCEYFYMQGLKSRSFKAFKLFAQVAGNRQYEKKVKERIDLTVSHLVEERKSEKEFLEAMIRELEEQYRIELRKKAILKSQCDQAYLRGVSAISMEALKMSHSTLQDYYRGMKMPQYDGTNIYEQIMRMRQETGQPGQNGAPQPASQQITRIVQETVHTVQHRNGEYVRGRSELDQSFGNGQRQSTQQLQHSQSHHQQ